MDYLLKSSVAGITASAMEGKEILDVNDKLIQTSDAEWAGTANDVVDKICSYINNGVGDTCADINTGYDGPPDHPKDFLKVEGTNLVKTFFESNMSTATIMKLFLEYEKEEEGNNDVKTGGGDSIPEVPKVDVPEVPKVDVPEVPKVDVPEIPKVDVPEIPKVDVPEIPKVDVPEIPSPEDDPTKALGLAAGVAGIDVGGLAGAAGLGGADGILPPKDGVRSTEPGEIMRVWSNKVGKQIECSSFVHERVKKLIQTVYRNTLQELEEDGSKILKDALEETRLKFRTKINNERIDALKTLLDALKPYLSLEDDNLRKNGIKQYVHAVGDLYYYLINEDTSTDYSNSVNKSKTYIDNIKEEDELKAVVTKMAKKYDDFIDALNLKFTVPPTTQTDKEGTIIEDIMRNPFETKTGGNNRLHNKTKRRRIKSKNRTR
jgi:hypothetical protein